MRLGSRLQNLAPGRRRETFSQKTKTFTPGKSENEGIRRIPSRTRGTGWPHPSLDGEVGPVKDHDEHNQADILTSGFDLAPAFPPAQTAEWNSGLMGVCNPLQWRNRPRFSRGSLTPDRDDDELQVHQTFKERETDTLDVKSLQEKKCRKNISDRPRLTSPAEKRRTLTRVVR